MVPPVLGICPGIRLQMLSLMASQPNWRIAPLWGGVEVEAEKGACLTERTVGPGFLAN